jgi:hypothetical protein
MVSETRRVCTLKMSPLLFVIIIMMRLYCISTVLYANLPIPYQIFVLFVVNSVEEPHYFFMRLRLRTV